MRFLAVVVFLLLANFSFANKLPLPTDNTPVQVRKPTESQLNTYRQDPAYQYYEEEAPPPQDFWGYLWRSIIRWLDEFFGNPDYGTTRKVLGYLFVATMAIFVILKLIGVDFAGVLSKKSSQLVPYDILGEDIHGIPFAEAIENATRTGNYRLAVRLYYLRMLKDLSDNGLIDWQLNKTNRVYSYELKGELKDSFEVITAQFEYVWYGDFALNKAYFNQIRQEFDAFGGQLKQQNSQHA